jgi:hypothetical protein
MIDMVNIVRFVCWLVTTPVVLALAACAAGSEPGTARPTSPGTAATTPPASPSPSPSPSLTPSPTPTPAPTVLPKAADGTRLSACRDGRCEVTVSAGKVIQFAQSLGLYSVNVYSIKGDEIYLLAAMTGGGSFSCDGDDRCQVSIQGATAEVPATGTFVVHPGARVQMGKVRIKVSAVVRGKAVLRLTRA